MTFEFFPPLIPYNAVLDKNSFRASYIQNIQILFHILCIHFFFLYFTYVYDNFFLYIY